MGDMTSREDNLKSTFAAAVGSRPKGQAATPAATGMQAGKTMDRSLFLLDLDRIQPDADQIRRMNKESDDPTIIELSESIREHGVLEPLNVRYIQEADIYELIAGERRYTAAKRAGKTQVPVKLIEADDKKARLIQLHENIHRQDLEPIELADALQSLIDDGASIEQLTTMLHKSEPYVRKALAISRKLTPEAREVLKDAPAEAKSMEQAYHLSQLPPEQQQPMAKQIVEKKLSRNQVRQVTAKAKKEHRETKGETRGRPTSTKPYSKTIASPNGAKIVISFRKAKVSDDEVRQALQQALDSLDS